jgi:hypothetical protein
LHQNKTTKAQKKNIQKPSIKIKLEYRGDKVYIQNNLSAKSLQNESRIKQNKNKKQIIQLPRHVHLQVPKRDR